MVLNLDENYKDFSISWEMQIIELNNQFQNGFVIKSKKSES